MHRISDLVGMQQKVDYLKAHFCCNCAKVQTWRNGEESIDVVSDVTLDGLDVIVHLTSGGTIRILSSAEFLDDDLELGRVITHLNNGSEVVFYPPCLDPHKSLFFATRAA